jgi:hypothetical protein
MKSDSTDSSKKDLLCHRWVEFAFKPNLESSAQPVDNSRSDEIIFKNDGTFQENSRYKKNSFKISGTYFLNDDTTKMEFMLLSMNGKSYPPFPETSRHYNKIILKLTTDTLIYGNEFYNGTETSSTLVYDHSDQYFVRKDQ